MYEQNLPDLLGQFSPFDAMEAEYIQQLLQYAEVISEPDGKLLFRRGKRAEFRYYLLEGSVELISAGFSSELVKAGSERARLPLSEATPTQVSAVAKSKVRLLKVDSDFLDLVLAWSEAPLDDLQLDTDNTAWLETNPAAAMNVEVLHNDWMSGLLSSPLLRRIPSANIQQLFARFERVSASAGSVVIQEGGVGDYFYIIDTGKVRISSITGSKDITLGPGQYFGEEALVADTPRNATVTMLADGVLMRLGKDDFSNLLHKPIQQYISAAQLAELQGKVSLLDVRTAMEFRLQHAHGSVNLPLSRLRDKLPELGKGTRYVLAPEAGRRAQLAAYLLAQEGYETFLLAAESSPWQLE
ncbi:MAG: cyclic nucleotide-binding domain-containing protein [Gammaproteobacteria bacterium]|nr:cyclic nucleotide-binding domain-containing protein [Gammaproteobacteria bacterium]